jgi:hypothetical protein
MIISLLSYLVKASKQNLMPDRNLVAKFGEKVRFNQQVNGRHKSDDELHYSRRLKQFEKTEKIISKKHRRAHIIRLFADILLIGQNKLVCLLLENL